MQIYNDDIAGIYHRFNRFIVEAQKSASANVSDVNEFDRTRLLSYLSALTTYINHVVSQPNLDLPETHPKPIELESIPEVQKTENLMVRDLVRLFERGRDEIINSQSARNATGLIGFDEMRLRSVILKAENYINNYVDTTAPLDLPESSPSSDMTGLGKVGV